MDGNLGSSVLTFELHHNSNTFPFSSLLDDILSDFFSVLNEKIITRPRGPNLGARVAAGPGSPPKTLMLTELVNYFTESDLVWIDFWWHFFMAIKLIMIKLI